MSPRRAAHPATSIAIFKISDRLRAAERHVAAVADLVAVEDRTELAEIVKALEVLATAYEMAKL